jgi:hypothetical protein
MLSDNSFILEELQRSKASDSRTEIMKQKEKEAKFGAINTTSPTDTNTNAIVKSVANTDAKADSLAKILTDSNANTNSQADSQANTNAKVGLEQSAQVNGSALPSSRNNTSPSQSDSVETIPLLGSPNSNDVSHEETSLRSYVAKKKRKAAKDSFLKSKKKRKISRGIVEELPEYIVEKIVDKRFYQGRWQYLLKWEGYSSSENTWEDIDHLNCPDLLEEFEREWKKKQKAKDTTPKEKSKDKTKKDKKDKKEKRKEKHKQKASHKQKANHKQTEASEMQLKETPRESQVEMSVGEREQPFKSTFQASKPTTIVTVNQDLVKNQLVVHDDKTVLAHDKNIPVGFDRGDEIQEIVGARIIRGKLCLYILWKGKNICTFVPAELCNKYAPQKVISFYESRLRFEEGTPT